MIRSFMPLDILDLLVVGKALSNRAKTRDSVGKKDARFRDLANMLGDWFNPQLRPCVWVYTEGLSLKGLASARDRNTSHAWDINRLLVPDHDTKYCLSLLEHVTRVGGQLEIGRIFLRLPHDSPLLKTAQETGFLRYSLEHLYWRGKGNGTKERIKPQPTPPARRKKPDDDFRLYELYHRCVPPHVRRAEGVTYREWQSNRERSLGQEWVFEKGGELVGWVAIHAGRDWGQFGMLAATMDEMHLAVEYSLSALEDCEQTYCLVPDYEGALPQLLQDRGFSRVMTHSVLAKELPVRVVEPCVMPAVPA